MSTMSLAAPVRRGVTQARQLLAELTEAWGVAWRRSLQLRVVISTLALSTAVIVVLGFVLQTQIAQRVLQGKEADALARTESGAVILERDLSGVDPDREGAQGELKFYLLFPLMTEQRTLGLVQSTLIVAGLILLLLLAGIAGIVTRQVVRPVQQAAEIAERFAEGHLDERMPVQGEDEVARLGESFNEMASSIQSQIRQLEEFGALQRRFTSDVSHELRTPLTTVRMAADVLHASREQFPAGLARSTELLVDELDRFESLLGDLLEDSRLDGGWLEAWGEPGHGAVFRLTLPRKHGEEVRESPLPLAPAIELEPV